MQIEKALKIDRLRISKVSWKFRTPTTYNFAVIYLLSFPFINKTLRLNNSKIRTAMNAKILLFVICVICAIIYLLLYNLHDCTFNIFGPQWGHCRKVS